MVDQQIEQRERVKKVIAGLKFPWSCSVVGCKNPVYPDFQTLLSFIDDGIRSWGKNYKKYIRQSLYIALQQ